jgi:hypothetical protein
LVRSIAGITRHRLRLVEIGADFEGADESEPSAMMKTPKNRMVTTIAIIPGTSSPDLPITSHVAGNARMKAIK